MYTGKWSDTVFEAARLPLLCLLLLDRRGAVVVAVAWWLLFLCYAKLQSAHVCHRHLFTFLQTLTSPPSSRGRSQDAPDAPESRPTYLCIAARVEDCLFPQLQANSNKPRQSKRSRPARLITARADFDSRRQYNQALISPSATNTDAYFQTSLERIRIRATILLNLPFFERESGTSARQYRLYQDHGDRASEQDFRRSLDTNTIHQYHVSKHRIGRFVPRYERYSPDT